MIKLRKILVWIIMSLTLQTSILFYLNKFYLAEEYKITFIQEEKEVYKEAVKEVNIPKTGKNIKLSPSGKYAYYLLENIPHIINLADNKDNVVNLEYDINNYFFKWHDFDDKLIITERIKSKKNDEIKLYIYDAKDNKKQEALDYNNVSRFYKLPGKNMNVRDIRLNTLNTIIYVKSEKENGSTYINRLDVSDGMHELPIKNINIGNFFVLKEKDEVVFEDRSNKNIYITNKGKTEEIKISAESKSILLNIDKDDNIYVGEIENNMVKAIFYNNQNDGEWKKIELTELIGKDSIYIFNPKEIYTVNSIENTVTNITNGKKKSFEGTFLDMNLSGILSSIGEGSIFIKVKEEEK